VGSTYAVFQLAVSAGTGAMSPRIFGGTLCTSTVAPNFVVVPKWPLHFEC